MCSDTFHGETLIRCFVTGETVHGRLGKSIPRIAIQEAGYSIENKDNLVGHFFIPFSTILREKETEQVFDYVIKYCHTKSRQSSWEPPSIVGSKSYRSLGKTSIIGQTLSSPYLSTSCGHRNLSRRQCNFYFISVFHISVRNTSVRFLWCHKKIRWIYDARFLQNTSVSYVSTRKSAPL